MTLKTGAANPNNPKSRFVSTIPGQMMDEDEAISIPFLLISLFGATLAFLLSLSWAAFLGDSVEAVQKATGNKIPLPVARLIAAIIVSCVAVSLLVWMYHLERKVAREHEHEHEHEHEN